MDAFGDTLDLVPMTWKGQGKRHDVYGSFHVHPTIHCRESMKPLQNW